MFKKPPYFRISVLQECCLYRNAVANVVALSPR